MPIIQLSFPNPLNTSVQVGDNAYFSNPTPVGIIGNPLGGPWTSTTTPHVANDIDGVVDLGEIVAITPWDGTNSFIQCNMDQVLFNKYFAMLVVGGCVTAPTGNVTATGHCALFQNGGALDHPVSDYTIPDFSNIYYSTPLNPHPSNPLHYLFDNPTISNYDVMFHVARPLPGDPNACEVDPAPENDYIAGAQNYWGLIHNVVIPLVNCSGAYGNTSCLFPLSSPSGPGETTAGNADIILGEFTANDIIGKMMNLYPTAGYAYGMSYVDFVNFHGNYQDNLLIQIVGYSNSIPESYATISHQLSAIGGSYSDTYVETCSQGSYIMFSKDNKANLSSMLGYYASVEYRNSSQIKSELFNVGAGVFESSK
tara:strand:- start:46 stop:1149 length:1104 start_codon:yes stop_codon:yes gene_type:complete